VRKVLRSEETEFRYEREVQPLPRIGAVAGTGRDAAGGERGASGAGAADADPDLRGAARLGYEGGYDAVRRYARSWRRSAAAVRPRPMCR
jgi:hypothetical protein